MVATVLNAKALWFSILSKRSIFLWRALFSCLFLWILFCFLLIHDSYIHKTFPYFSWPPSVFLFILFFPFLLWIISLSSPSTPVWLSSHFRKVLWHKYELTLLVPWQSIFNAWKTSGWRVKAGKKKKERNCISLSDRDSVPNQREITSK